MTVSPLKGNERELATPRRAITPPLQFLAVLAALALAAFSGISGFWPLAALAALIALVAYSEGLIEHLYATGAAADAELELAAITAPTTEAVEVLA